MAARSKPWGKLAKAMAEAGTPDADFEAWMIWLRGKCPKTYDRLASTEGAGEFKLFCRELYDQFTGSDQASAVT